MLNRVLILALFLAAGTAGMAHAQTVPTTPLNEAAASSGSSQQVAPSADKSQKASATTPKAGKAKGQGKRGSAGEAKSHGGGNGSSMR